MLRDTQETIRATYLIETPHPVEHAAEVLAGEQSSGTFTPVPGETEELKQRFRARVVCIEPRDASDTPSLPGSRPPSARYQRARLVVDFPVVNMGTNLPTLLATLTGNLFELAELSGVRLLDLDLPPAFAEAYAGPALGIDGTRRLTCVQHRPLIGTIIKPSVGLSPQATADLVKVLVDGGVDFIKDDELMANPPHSPLAERGVRRVVVAGGDTSGYVVRALGIQALEMAAPTTPGAPVCRAYAADALDGVQLILKGGQVGRDAFFVDARERVEHQ